MMAIPTNYRTKKLIPGEMMRRSLPPSRLDNEPTLLIVEDDASLRATSAEFLIECGYTVIEAEDAEQARRVLDSGVRVDLVFSDVRMPGDIVARGLLADLLRDRWG